MRTKKFTVGNTTGRPLFLTCLLLLALAPGLLAQTAGYEYRKLITLNSSQISGSTNHVNFPVMVSLTDTMLRSTSNGGGVENPSGYDILFTQSDKTTLLDFELQQYSSTTGEILFWVRMPTLSPSVDSTIYLYYGKTGIYSDQSDSSTWNDNYIGVWHLEDLTDAAGTRTLTDHNTITNASGKLGAAREFDGDGDDLEDLDGANYLDGHNDISVSMWVKADALGTDRGLLYADDPDDNDRRLMIRMDAAGEKGGGTNVYRTAMLVGSNNRQRHESSDGSATTNWQYLTLTRTPGSDTDFYIDGSLDTPSWGNSKSGSTNKSEKLLIGKGSKDGATSSWDGLIDEVRISSVQLSADWIATEYENMTDPGNFLTVSTANELPTLTDIEAVALSYQSDDPAKIITNSLTCHDYSEFNLDSAKVWISSNYLSSEDTLTFTTNYGISGTWTDGSGLLKLTGNASLADYSSALQEIYYHNSNSSPSTATRTISFIVSDGDGYSDTTSRDITMNALNSAPSLASIEGTTLAYTDGDPDTIITSTLAISDADDAYLDTAWVTITNNYISGEDKLDFTSMYGITPSWSSVNGILTLTGSAALADYQTALRTVTYVNLNPDPDESVRTIAFKVSDGQAHSDTVSRNLDVTAINDAPVLADIEHAGIVYEAGDGEVSVTDSLTVSDGDDTMIDSATVQITTNYHAGEDSLIYSTIYGISGSWNGTNGKLYLTGTATLAQYEDALQTINYENVNPTPHTPTRVITFRVHDGDTFSNSVTRAIAAGEPATITGLELWLNAGESVYTNTGATTDATDGDLVRIWRDQSTNSRLFENQGGRPNWRESVVSLNGESALEFTGGMRMQDTDAEILINGMTEFTLFMVVESDVTSVDNDLWNVENTGNGDRYFSLRYDATGDNSSDLNVIKAAVLDDVAANELESSEQRQSTGGQILCLDWKSNEVWDLYINGVLNSPSYSGDPPSGSISDANRIAIGLGAANSGWDGMIAEVVLYDHHLSENDRINLEHYFSDKYAISVHLLEKATGADSISADDANTTWTTLTGPRVSEQYAGEYSLNGTIVLTAPDGFEFDTGGGAPAVTVNEAYGTSTALTASFTSRTDSTITYTIDTQSNASSSPAEVIFSDVRIRPTSGTVPNSGILINTGTTGPADNVNMGDINMIAGAPTKLVYIQEPGNGTVDEVLTPAIVAEIQDTNDNTIMVAETEVTIAKTLGSGTLTGTDTLSTNAQGQVSFSDLVLDAADDYKLTVSSSGLTAAESDTFSVVVAGQFVKFLLEKQSGGNILTQTAGTEFNMKISAVDGTDTPDTNFTGTVVLTSTGAIGTGGDTTAAFTKGVLNPHTISINSIGNYTITATYPSGSEYGTSNSFDVDSGPASASASTISASPTVLQNDAVSTSTITVQIKDAGGNDHTSGGETVNLLTTAGTLLGSVTDNGDGTYSQTLRSSSTVETATITGVLNGNSMSDDASVQFNAYTNIWETDPGNDPYTTKWDTLVNWDNGIPDNTDAVLIPGDPADGSNFPTITTDNQEVSTMTIESGADVTLSGGISFTILGDLLGDGEIIGGGATSDTLRVTGDMGVGSSNLKYIEFTGSSLQSITSPLTYKNVRIDNTSGVSVDGNMEVTDTLTLESGSLIIPSGKSLIANTKSVLSGKIRAEREVNGSTGWRLHASPVISTFGDLYNNIFTQGYGGSDSSSGSPSVLWYDETYSGTDNQRWRRPDTTADTTVAGRGMFVYVFGSIVGEAAYSQSLPITLDVSGTEAEGSGGSFDFGVTYTASADTGWNLIGNPFVATIDWDAAGWTKTNMDNVIYVWDHSANSGAGAYLTWNGTSGSLGSGLIPPFQGFWVKANATSPVLKVPKSAKTIGGVFYKRTASPTQLMLLLESDTLGATTHIQFTEDGSMKKDRYDAHYLVPPTETYLELYTESLDHHLLAIQNQPYRFGMPIDLPVYVSGYTNTEPLGGTYRISWPKMDGLHEEWTLSLIDQLTGDQIDLQAESFYDFELDASLARPLSTLKPSRQLAETQAFNVLKKHVAETPRFILRVDPGNAFPEIPREYALQQNFPNPFNNGTTIQFYLPMEGEVSLVLYDMLGREIDRLVDQETYPAGIHSMNWTGMEQSSGLYFYRLQVGEQSFTKKMILLR